MPENGGETPVCAGETSWITSNDTGLKSAYNNSVELEYKFEEKTQKMLERVQRMKKTLFKRSKSDKSAHWRCSGKKGHSG